MPLSEDEQRILQQIERSLYEQDPHFAGEIGNHSLYTSHVRQLKVATAVFVVGVTTLVVALAFEHSFLVAFGGFVVMLASALWFEWHLRKLGRAGVDHLTESLRRRGFGDSFRDATERARGRMRHEQEDEER